MACAIPINEKLTVKKAAEICQSKGAFLPFITTAREQRYLNHKRKKVFALTYQVEPRIQKYVHFLVEF